MHNRITGRMINHHFPCSIPLPAQDSNGQGGHISFGAWRGPFHQVESNVPRNDHLMRAVSERDSLFHKLLEHRP